MSGPPDELARLRIDRDHDDDHTVARELATVAQHLAPDVADAEAVDERHAGLDAVDDLDPLPHLDDVAVLADDRRGRAGCRPPPRGARDAAGGGARRGSG